MSFAIEDVPKMAGLRHPSAIERLNEKTFAVVVNVNDDSEIDMCGGERENDE